MFVILFPGPFRFLGTHSVMTFSLKWHPKKFTQKSPFTPEQHRWVVLEYGAVRNIIILRRKAAYSCGRKHVTRTTSGFSRTGLHPIYRQEIVWIRLSMDESVKCIMHDRLSPRSFLPRLLVLGCSNARGIKESPLDHKRA